MGRNSSTERAQFREILKSELANDLWICGKRPRGPGLGISSSDFEVRYREDFDAFRTWHEVKPLLILCGQRSMLECSENQSSNRERIV